MPMTRCLAIAAVVGLSFALCACGEAGDPDRQTAGQQLADAFSSTARAATRSAQGAQAFASTIAADDAYEVAAAGLAKRMSRREDVRGFATQMIQDHAVVGDELRDALNRTHGVEADPRLSPAQHQALDRLRKAGAGFDDAYAKQEIAGHEQELSTLRDYADNGMDPALSEFAADAENMAADHLSLARKLS
jgi:putative membrane protein